MSRLMSPFAVLLLCCLLISPVTAQEDQHTVAFDGIRLTYPSSLFAGLQIEPIPAVPYSETVLFAETHPAHLRFSALDFADGLSYQLPYPLVSPQILFYPVSALRDFGYEFAAQYDALAALLSERPSLDTAAALPFLPWTNAAQVLRARPQYIEMEGGSGLRYLTFYAQGIEPLTDQAIFYTFQGIVADGAYYVSAIFPIKTSVFPEQIDPATLDMDALASGYAAYLTESLTQIESLADADFYPALTTLDGLIASIAVQE